MGEGAGGSNVYYWNELEQKLESRSSIIVKDSNVTLPSTSLTKNAVEVMSSQYVQQMIYIVETWHSGTSWYRVWSDGWIEQGGTSNISSRTTTITLKLAYTNTNYGVLGTIRVTGDPNNGNQTLMIAPISTTQIRGYLDWVNNSATLNCTWYCFGY